MDNTKSNNQIKEQLCKRVKIKQNILTNKLNEMKQFFIQATMNGPYKTSLSFKSSNIVW